MSEITWNKEIRGALVEIHAAGFCGAEPDVGIMGPYYEEIWATNLDGTPFELTDEEQEECDREACERLPDDHDFWD